MPQAKKPVRNHSRQRCGGALYSYSYSSTQVKCEPYRSEIPNFLLSIVHMQTCRSTTSSKPTLPRPSAMPTSPIHSKKSSPKKQNTPPPSGYSQTPMGVTTSFPTPLMPTTLPSSTSHSQARPSTAPTSSRTTFLPNTRPS